MFLSFCVCSNEACADSRHRTGMVDLYFTLFGTGRPSCLLHEEQAGREEAQSRRKSQIVTREVDEQIHDVRPERDNRKLRICAVPGRFALPLPFAYF